ncbi:hypothetical protein [Dyadobacter sp. 32]|uniref:hypothetical protein n=1 Tax=Dyadobacter sp. 32 TaxID=538966 RepID=UPI0011EED920
MNLKQKIALADLAKKVERGIISEEKGKVLFEQITGRNADAVPVPGEDDKLVAQVDAIAKTVGKGKGAKGKAVAEPETEKKSEADPESQFKVATAEEVLSLLQQLKVQEQNPEAHQDRIDTVRTVQMEEQ